MSNRSNALADTVVAVLIALIGYCAYAERDLLVLLGGASLCAVAAQPVIEKLTGQGLGEWRPGRVQSVLIVLFGAAEITLIALSLAPWLGGNLREVSVGGHALRWLAGLLDRVPTLTAAAMYVYFTQATIIALAGLLIIVGLARRTKSVPSDAAADAAVLAPSPLGNRAQFTGKLVLAMSAGVTSFVVLGLLQVPHYHALAALAAIGVLVPVAGPLVTVVACVAAVSDSAGKVAAVLAFFFLYYELEHSLIRPHADDPERAIGLLAVVVSLMLGMTIAGLAGALIAIPAGAIAAIILGSLLSPHEERDEPLDACAACEFEMQNHGALILPPAEPADVAPGPGVVIDPPGVAMQALIEMGVAALAALAAFKLLDLRYPYELAALTGLGSAVPVAGPLAAALACAVVAATGSTAALVGVLAFFLCYFQLARLIIKPRLHGVTIATPKIMVPAIALAAFATTALAGMIAGIAIVALASISLKPRLTTGRASSSLTQAARS